MTPAANTRHPGFERLCAAVEREWGHVGLVIAAGLPIIQIRDEDGRVLRTYKPKSWAVFNDVASGLAASIAGTEA